MYLCIFIYNIYYQFSSVALSCPTFCDPMEYLLYIHTICVNKNTQIIYIHTFLICIYVCYIYICNKSNIQMHICTSYMYIKELLHGYACTAYAYETYTPSCTHINTCYICVI